MQKKSRAELEKQRITKTLRTLVRLKHSLAADEELNNVLPDTLAEFDTALASGKLKKLPSNLVIEVLGDGNAPSA